MLTHASLVMLLIQSEMFKALWYMVYPIVVFCRGPIPNKSSLCQVNGFFLTLGTEASGTCLIIVQFRSLTLSRFCRSDDCRPYRVVHIQATTHGGRGSLSVSALRIYTLDCFPCFDGFSCIRQRPPSICIRGYILLSSSSTILVPTRTWLDSSICHFHFYSRHIRIHLLLRPL